MADKKKKKKKKKEFSPMQFPPPQERNLGGEFKELAPLLGDLARTQSELDIAATKQLSEYSIDFFRKYYDEIANKEIDAQSRATLRTRQDAQGYLGAQGANARAQARAANPEWAQQMDKINQMVGQIGKVNPELAAMRNLALGQGSEGEITRTLNQQALSDLKLGGALTPEEERAVQQSSREAFAARGMAMSDPSAVAEILARDSYSRQRLQERQAFAGQRESTNAQMLGQSSQMGLNRDITDRQFALSAAQLSDATSPIWKILGMPSPQATIPGAVLQQANTQAPSVGGIMGAGLGYGSDLYSSNLNMQTDLFTTGENNAAMIAGARIQSEAQLKAAKLQANAQVGAAQAGASGAMGGALIGAGGAVIGGVIAAF